MSQLAVLQRLVQQQKDTRAPALAKARAEVEEKMVQEAVKAAEERISERRRESKEAGLPSPRSIATAKTWKKVGEKAAGGSTKRAKEPLAAPPIDVVMAQPRTGWRGLREMRAHTEPSANERAEAQVRSLTHSWAASAKSSSAAAKLNAKVAENRRRLAERRRELEGQMRAKLYLVREISAKEAAQTAVKTSWRGLRNFQRSFFRALQAEHTIVAAVAPSVDNLSGDKMRDENIVHIFFLTMMSELCVLCMLRGGAEVPKPDATNTNRHTILPLPKPLTSARPRRSRHTGAHLQSHHRHQRRDHNRHLRGDSNGLEARLPLRQQAAVEAQGPGEGGRGDDDPAAFPAEEEVAQEEAEERARAARVLPTVGQMLATHLASLVRLHVAVLVALALVPLHRSLHQSRGMPLPRLQQAATQGPKGPQQRWWPHGDVCR